MKSRILVAEDEKDINNLLRVNFEEAGYEVYSARDGIEALEVLKSTQIDLAVLDVMMPRLDGFNLLRKMREITTIPVIFLTARDSEMDKVLGLGIGADDYLVKPFQVSELLARVAAQLRRNCEYQIPRVEQTENLHYGNMALDTQACCLYKEGELIELGAKEYRLLLHFMENPGKVYTKKQLYRIVWEEDIYFDDNTVMVHISHLRNKIEDDPRNPKWIITIRGIGYRFQKG
ncbi:MAG TPA: response regulator transcription factor [Lachnospiraceae bacterium]|nr:response regulator transcription factor [Lachnospiraceae bacterium]